MYMLHYAGRWIPSVRSADSTASATTGSIRRRQLRADDAVTHYEHGVLSVTLPKAEEKKARRLEIGTPTA